MYSIVTQVKNKTGLHARPASDLTLKAKEFACSITLLNMDEPDAKPLNAKSVVKIMAGKMKMGTRIEIAAEGEDEKQAVEALAALLESGFGD
jgi:Phosphotransferase System HPr (HPr) Family